MGFRALAAACVLLASSTAWGSTGRLTVAPVRLLGYVGDKLKVSIEMPCGAEFVGLVASPEKTKGRLQVAAAVRSSDVMCTSLPEGEHFLVDYLATRDFRVIAPMDVSGWKGRLVMAPIKDLRLFDATKAEGKKAASEKILQGVYETKCGQHVGTLIKQTADAGLQVAFMEHLVRGQRTKDCPAEQKVRRIKAIKLTAGLKIATLRRTDSEAAKTFHLRIAKVNPKSFRRQESGGLRFQYLRRCNEAPIGIVVGKRTLAKRPGGAPIRRATFGMLVAQYPKMDCLASEATEAWTAYQTKDVSLPRGWRVALMKPTRVDTRLEVKSPLDFAKLTKQKKKGLFVDFIKGCDLTVGAVYARSMWAEAGSVLSVGVLSQKAGLTCQKQVSQASLYQPFISKKVAVTDMFPLKIAGAKAH